MLYIHFISCAFINAVFLSVWTGLRFIFCGFLFSEAHVIFLKTCEVRFYCLSVVVSVISIEFSNLEITPYMD